MGFTKAEARATDVSYVRPSLAPGQRRSRGQRRHIRRAMAAERERLSQETVRRRNEFKGMAKARRREAEQREERRREAERDRERFTYRPAPRDDSYIYVPPIRRSLFSWD